MALLKWIVCQVTDPRAFCIAQEEWGALAKQRGFEFQLGGWQSSNQACILGCWSSDADYCSFMEKFHDSIYLANKQSSTYQNSKVNLGKMKLEISGESNGLSAAAADSRFLRLAHCHTIPGTENEFFRVQQTIWNPGMAQCPGMLGGCVTEIGPDEFLVASFWEDEAAHARYQVEFFPELREAAILSSHLENVTGFAFPLEQSWTVVALDSAC